MMAKHDLNQALQRMRAKTSPNPAKVRIIGVYVRPRQLHNG